MIGKLTGLVDSQGEDHVILDVHGVGYVVHCSARTLQSLPAAGEPVSLAVETQMREDSIRLFGFANAAERDWFRLLQSVQSVGSKVALAILGVLGPSELATALACADKAAFARAPGVGPKLAARIVAELKDKAPVFGALETFGSAGRAASPSGEGPAEAGPAAGALSALANLGFGRSEAGLAVASAMRELGEGATEAVVIKRALRELQQGGG